MESDMVLLSVDFARAEHLARLTTGLRRSGQTFVKIPALLREQSGELRGRDAVYTADPSRQMALICKPGLCRNFSQSHAPVPDVLDRRVKAKMDHIAIRRHADGAGEHTREMEL